MHKKTESDAAPHTSRQSLNNLKSGQAYKGDVLIISRIQPGPIIYTITDGSSSIEALTYPSASKEGYSVGDVVSITGKAVDRGRQLQIEINSLKSTGISQESFLDDAVLIDTDRLSVQTKGYNTLLPHIIRSARCIKKAYTAGHSIIIKHHNDADGISAALALHAALEPIVQRNGYPQRMPLLRFVSRSPYYDITDLFKELEFINRQNLRPFFIFLDIGSGKENNFAFSLLNQLDIPFCVIDHHGSEDLGSITALSRDHLNPHLYGLDSSITAGMLSFEVACILDSKVAASSPILPAISAIGDKSDSAEAQHYISKSKLSSEDLMRYALALDFMSYNLRYDSGDFLYDRIIRDKAFAYSLAEHADGLLARSAHLVPKKIQHHGSNKDASCIIVDLSTHPAHSFPPPGKLTGYIFRQHGRSSRSSEDQLRYCVCGVLDDGLILRSTKSSLTLSSLASILSEQFKDLADSAITYAGHESAGTISFPPAIREEVKAFLQENLLSLLISVPKQ